MSGACEVIVKIGGSTLGGHDTTMDDLAALHEKGRKVVVVHGGGATITDWLAKQGIEARFEHGLRVTGDASLDVVVAVLAGLVNKRLVAALQGRGVPAVGLCGGDGGLLRASVHNAGLGRVGEIDRVETAVVETLLRAGYLPVIAPVGLEDVGKPTGGLLNINADTAAGRIAAALKADRLVFLTDVPGIMDAEKRVLSRLTPADTHLMMRTGVITGGMIPKAQAALLAVSGGASTIIVDGREPNALLRALSPETAGTTIG